MYFLNKTENGCSIRLDHFGLANYTGLISAIILLALLIFSNDYFIRKLGPGRWKNVQRLTYLMFLLTVIHSVLYRAPKAQPGMIYTFYIPVTAIVLAFQITGIILVRKQGN
jgi:sulfoxide reductase heme-binding subunit YedZ